MLQKLPSRYQAMLPLEILGFAEVVPSRASFETKKVDLCESLYLYIFMSRNNIDSRDDMSFEIVMR